MTTTETITLTDFLLARIDEDWAVAREAQQGTDGESWWTRTDPKRKEVWGAPTMRVPVADVCSWRVAPHIARFDPARVLDECDAKRWIVRDHKIITVWPDGTAGAKYYTGSKRVCASCDERMPVPCRTLRFLALPYATHPDYREDWRP